MIVYYCCLILVQLQSNVHFQMTVEDFLCRRQPNLHANFLTVTFRAEHLSLMVLSLFQVGMQIILHVLLYTEPYDCMLGVGQVDFSLDLLISLKVPKSNRSEDPFFFPVHLPLLYVYEMLATATIHSVCTQSTCEFTLYNNSLKTLRRQSYFCQKLLFISCPMQMLLS